MTSATAPARTATRPAFLPASTATPSSVLSTPHELRVVQVQVVHRHGDRTPITPLLNESYWASELVPDQLLQRVASTTSILREGEEIKHVAGGRGPFGKLTQLGLLQMVQVGTELRDQLVLEGEKESTAADNHAVDEHGHVYWNKGRLFDSKSNPIHPSKLRVWSTDFPRTIQSVQGTLVGLFPDPADTSVPIQVDVRHTNNMIPDPQPRQSIEQEELERTLAARPHLRAMEKEMKALAVEVTQSLNHLLSDDAFAVSFGVGEEKDDEDEPKKPSAKSKPVLSWAQLSEITKCLQTRDMLPPTITSDMQTQISRHTAWRWFENLRHPRLAFLAMNSMVNKMLVSSIQDRIAQLAATTDREEDVPLLCIYSAHDSTLIGLMCAFRLEQPAEWPEYGSYFKMELIEAKPLDGTADVKYLVRFSLNGEVLRCKWENDDGSDTNEPLQMIPVELLSHYVATKGASV